MSARSPIGALSFRVRGSLAGLGAATLASIVLAFMAFTVMGTAGATWDTSSGRATLVISLCGLAFLALAVGGAVGAWQAAAGGARSRREAALAGAVAPAGAALMLSIVLAGPTAGGLGSGVVMVVGAAFGAWVLARRLEE